MRLLLALGLTTLVSAASLHAAGAHQAHSRANVGAHSSSVSEGAVAYIAAYNCVIAGQPIMRPNVPTAIEFPMVQSGVQKKICHPHHFEDSDFQIKLDGTYLIGWTMTFVNTNEPMPFPVLTVQLVNANVTPPKIIGPDPFGTEGLDQSATPPEFDSIRSASGQTIVKLKKGAVLQLLVTSSLTGVQVLDPTLFIVRIAD